MSSISQKDSTALCGRHLYELRYCGPIKQTSIQGHNYAVIVFCARLNFTTARFLAESKELPENMEAVFHYLQKIMKLALSHFRTENANAYISDKAKSMCNKYNLTHLLRTLHPPYENSIAEIFNRTLQKSIRATI